jgi:hypothetical protein
LNSVKCWAEVTLQKSIYVHVKDKKALSML